MLCHKHVAFSLKCGMTGGRSILERYDSQGLDNARITILFVKMEIALWHKFTQHAALRDELLATGDAELIEVRSLLQFTNLPPAKCK